MSTKKTKKQIIIEALTTDYLERYNFCSSKKKRRFAFFPVCSILGKKIWFKWYYLINLNSYAYFDMPKEIQTIFVSEQELFFINLRKV